MKKENLGESPYKHQTLQTQENTLFSHPDNQVWVQFKADDKLWDELWDNDSSEMKGFTLNKRWVFQNNLLSVCIVRALLSVVCVFNVARVPSSENITMYSLILMSFPLSLPVTGNYFTCLLVLTVLLS